LDKILEILQNGETLEKVKIIKDQKVRIGQDKILTTLVQGFETLDLALG